MHSLTQSTLLPILTYVPVDTVKLFADEIIEHLDEITVLQNRQRLIMPLSIDAAQGTCFYLEKALIAQQIEQHQANERLLRQVEATRVEVETF